MNRCSLRGAGRDPAYLDFIKSTINLATFRGILTPDGGEVVSADAF